MTSLEAGVVTSLGQGQAEQGFKASVDPGKPQVHKMVESVLTPPPPTPLKRCWMSHLQALHHPRAQWQPQFFVYGIVDVQCRSRYAYTVVKVSRAVSGNPSTSKASARSSPGPHRDCHAAGGAVPGEPPMGLCGTAIEQAAALFHRFCAHGKSPRCRGRAENCASNRRHNRGHRHH